jgi:hypothetical protein
MPVDGGRHAMCPRWNKTWIILNNGFCVSKNVSCGYNHILSFIMCCILYLHILD